VAVVLVEAVDLALMAATAILHQPRLLHLKEIMVVTLLLDLVAVAAVPERLAQMLYQTIRVVLAVQEQLLLLPGLLLHGLVVAVEREQQLLGRLLVVAVQGQQETVMLLVER
jgi:hypothetical protein